MHAANTGPESESHLDRSVEPHRGSRGEIATTGRCNPLQPLTDEVNRSEVGV